MAGNAQAINAFGLKLLLAATSSEAPATEARKSISAAISPVGMSLGVLTAAEGAQEEQSKTIRKSLGIEDIDNKKMKSLIEYVTISTLTAC